MFLLSCTNSDNEASTYAVPKSKEAESSMSSSGAMTDSSSGMVMPPASKKSSKFIWVTPKGWKEKEASSMRIGSFSTKKFGGVVADVSIVVLGGKAGGVVPNVNRWRRQLGLSPQSSNEIEGQTLSISSSRKWFKILNATSNEGIFVSMFHDGDDMVFIKMRGKNKVLINQVEKFKKLVASIKRK